MLSPEQLIQESASLLEEMLHIPAFSGQEADKASFLEEWLLSRGYSPKRSGNNIWLEHRMEGAKKTLWLHSHIDTVKPAESWKTDPFAAHWQEGRLTALGANDAGASVVTMLATFRALADAGFPMNLIWVAGAEEENSGPGGMEAMVRILPPADLVLVGEPTGMRAAVAERGLMVVDGLVRGVAGHAARNEGVNAIYRAMDDLAFFRDYSFEKKSGMLGPVSMNLTVIGAGEKHNSIPDLCRYTVDIRLNEHYSHSEVLEILREQVHAELQLRSERLKASATPENHSVLFALHKLGITGYGSPTLSDWALLPYPAVKIGPGDSARSHTAGEYILRQELEEALSLYLKLINTWKDEEIME